MLKDLLGEGGEGELFFTDTDHMQPGGVSHLVNMPEGVTHLVTQGFRWINMAVEVAKQSLQLQRNKVCGFGCTHACLQVQSNNLLESGDEENLKLKLFTHALGWLPKTPNFISFASDLIDDLQVRGPGQPANRCEFVTTLCHVLNLPLAVQLSIGLSLCHSHNPDNVQVCVSLLPPRKAGKRRACFSLGSAYCELLKCHSGIGCISMWVHVFPSRVISRIFRQRLEATGQTT